MRVSVLFDNKLCQEEPVDRNGENAILCTYCKLKYYGGNRKTICNMDFQLNV